MWYYPAVDYDYDTTGTASWYGEQFEGRLTANGEIFDLNQLSAAHTTLPMPSIVQVTNLENGRSLQLRVNDRGPFVDGRLIDVSRRAAQLLGFERRGTTLVRVKVLKDESIAAAEEAMHGRGQIMVAEASSGVAAAAAAAPPVYSRPPRHRRYPRRPPLRSRRGAPRLLRRQWRSPNRSHRRCRGWQWRPANRRHHGSRWCKASRRRALPRHPAPRRCRPACLTCRYPDFR